MPYLFKEPEIGTQYNDLTYLGLAGFRKYKSRHYRMAKFKCKCGLEIVGPLHLAKNGNSKSCGCSKKGKKKIRPIGLKYKKK